MQDLLASTTGDYFQQLLNYVVEAGEIENIDEFFQTLTQQLPEARGDIMTIAKRLEQRGEQRGMQRGMQQGMQQGMVQGRSAREYEMAKAMLNDGEPVEKISRYTHLSIDDIERLK